MTEKKEEMTFVSIAQSNGKDFPLLIISPPIKMDEPLPETLESLQSQLLESLETISVMDYAALILPVQKSFLPWTWMYNTYALTSRSARKNLKALYIVSPSPWTRWMLRLWGFITSPKFFQKIVVSLLLGELDHHHHQSRFIEDPLDAPVFLQQHVLDVLPEMKSSSLMSLEQKVQISGGTVFGIPLETLMGENGEKGLPVLVKDIIQILSSKEALHSQGLFRVSPVLSAVKRVRLGYDSGNEWIALKTLEKDPGKIHIASSLLKAFVRELPMPLIPETLFSSLDKLITYSSKERVNFIQSDILSKLSTPSLLLFQALMNLLSKVSERSSYNKMTSQNLAIVWAPNFLPFSFDHTCTSGGASTDTLIDLSASQDLGALNLLLQVCIDDYALLFHSNTT